jgi:hypothetical protein
MKKLFLLAVAVAMFSCEKDSNSIESTQEVAVDKVAAVMALEANPDLDNSQDGLFKGVFASYDLALKGTIMINMANDDKYEAAVVFHRGTEFVDKVYFKGQPHATDADVITFESTMGVFDATVTPQKEVVVEHFIFNGRDTYIAAFKTTRGAEVSLAMGNYVDDLDGSFAGNWDAIHLGTIHISPAGQHNPTADILELMEKVVVSTGTKMLISTDDATDNDSFGDPCGFYPGTFPQAWYYSNAVGTYREFFGVDQTTTLGTDVATWDMVYFFFSGQYYYDIHETDGSFSCFVLDSPAGTGYGSWSWRSRSGKLYADVLAVIL